MHARAAHTHTRARTHARASMHARTHTHTLTHTAACHSHVFITHLSIIRNTPVCLSHILPRYVAHFSVKHLSVIRHTSVFYISHTCRSLICLSCHTSVCVSEICQSVCHKSVCVSQICLSHVTHCKSASLYLSHIILFHICPFTWSWSISRPIMTLHVGVHGPYGVCA